MTSRPYSLILVAMLAAASADGQVSTRPVAPESAVKTDAVFDGSVNYLGSDPKGYVGEELFLPGLPESLRRYGWSGFCQLLPCGIAVSPEPYDALAGKYLRVEAVEPAPAGVGNSEVFILTLTEKGSDLRWYYRYKADSPHSFPFVAVKYFERQKRALVGRRFVSRGWNSHVVNGTVHDINTGRDVAFSPGTMWKCTDVSIEERFFALVMILRNDKGEEVPFSVERVADPVSILSAEEAGRIKRVHGEANYRAILDQKVRIGMSKPQVELSWGKPRDINRTVTRNGGTSEQWVYPDNYVYFDGGKVSAIQ